MANVSEEIKKQAEAALNDPAVIDELVNRLSLDTRRDRQTAASVLGLVAKSDPEKVVGKIDLFIDALNRPEAQTRWECLEILTTLVDLDARNCNRALPEAETALFDEDNGFVRLAALRFFCKYGASTVKRSEKVWPLIDEAIQCFHGDFEFNDMLTALVEFSTGKLDAEVKQQFAARMSFDAANGKGTLKRRAQAILDNLE